MKLRQRKNEILMIKDNTGVWLNEKKEIFNNIIHHFSNLFKSFVKFSPNTPTTLCNSMKSILCMEQRLVVDNYLGVPVDIQGKKTASFQPLIDRVANRLAAWSNKLISQSGKLVLLNSVLVALSSNVLAVMPIPISIANRIDALISAFWWQTSPTSGIPWVKRQTLHLPKGLGGLGIRNIFAFNQALLGKQVFRLRQHPQLLVSRILRSKYPHIWNLNATNCKIPIGSSWGHRGLLRVTVQKFKMILPYIKSAHAKNRLAIFRFFQPPDASQIIKMELPIFPSSDHIY
ncbi:hypothetical protein RDABS01_010498 [Bienertia sinuspersici]